MYTVMKPIIIEKVCRAFLAECKNKQPLCTNQGNKPNGCKGGILHTILRHKVADRRAITVNTFSFDGTFTG